MLILDSQELCDMFAFGIFQIYPIEQLKPINRGGNILPSNLTIQSAVLGIELQKLRYMQIGCTLPRKS